MNNTNAQQIAARFADELQRRNVPIADVRNAACNEITAQYAIDLLLRVPCVKRSEYGNGDLTVEKGFRNSVVAQFNQMCNDAHAAYERERLNDEYLKTQIEYAKTAKTTSKWSIFIAVLALIVSVLSLFIGK